MSEPNLIEIVAKAFCEHAGYYKWEETKGSVREWYLAGAKAVMDRAMDDIAELRTQLAARDAEIARLGERLKQAILSNATLLAEATQLRGALPALWGQYDDEGRKLWIDPKDAEIAWLRETLKAARPHILAGSVLMQIDAALKIFDEETSSAKLGK